jgi:4a-hydroxytetrahydrobiopterin dehydratase
MTLADRKCVACKSGDAPLGVDRVEALLRELGSDWRVDELGHLERVYPFPDFAGALAFANRVGAIAEEEGHHPDLHVAWGKCRVVIWTHAIGGLSESDFILAAKADRAFAS